MKAETKTFLFLSPPDSKNAALTLIQKPNGGAPLLFLNINDPKDVQALKNLLNQPSN